MKELLFVITSQTLFLLVNQILAVQYSVLLINAEQMLGNEPLAKWQ
jgi:hypothetical protein